MPARKLRRSWPYSQYAPLIRACFRAYFRPSSLADPDDWTQSLWCALYEAIHTFEPERNVPLGGWIKACVWRRAVLMRRAIEREPKRADLDHVTLAVPAQQAFYGEA